MKTELKPGDENVIVNHPVPTDKLTVPFLHVKLGLMKQFVEALDKEGKCFEYLCNTFPGISIDKKNFFFLMVQILENL